MFLSRAKAIPPSLINLLKASCLIITSMPKNKLLSKAKYGTADNPFEVSHISSSLASKKRHPYVHVISDDSSSEPGVTSPKAVKNKKKNVESVCSRPYHASRALAKDIKNADSVETISPESGITGNMQYPEARVFLVSGSKGDNMVGSISIDKILSCTNSMKPKKAVMTTYVLDFGWLRESIGEDTNICLAFHQRGHAKYTPGAFQVDVNTVFVTPPMPAQSGFSSYHPKLMLLWFDGFVRLVISSANLVNYDWDSIQNSVFVQDFSLLSEPSNGESDIKSQLVHFLEKSMFPKQVLKALQLVDFSSFKHQLVSSVAGKYTTEPLNDKYGYLALSRSIKSFDHLKGLKMDKLNYQCSSLGFLNYFWINQVIAELGQSCEAQVLFPTQEEVENSDLGPTGAGTVILSERGYNAKHFPRYSLYKSKSTVPGLLSHSKIMYPKYKNSDNTWMYLGSANFTKSAWGSFTKSNYSISNFEIGVLLNCYYKKDGIHLRNGTNPLKDYRIPLPFSLQWEKYSAEDKPWMLFRENDS